MIKEQISIIYHKIIKIILEMYINYLNIILNKVLIYLINNKINN